MARYAEKEAPLLERIIMQEGLERTKAEDWARDEITRLSEENARLSEENARLREALKGVIRIADRNTIEFNAARAAIREGGKDE